MTILHMLSEADHVFIHGEKRMAGTRNFTLQAMDPFRISEGKIAEHWDVIRGRGLLSSLALLTRVDDRRHIAAAAQRTRDEGKVGHGKDVINSCPVREVRLHSIASTGRSLRCTRKRRFLPSP